MVDGSRMFSQRWSYALEKILHLLQFPPFLIPSARYFFVLIYTNTFDFGPWAKNADVFLPMVMASSLNAIPQRHGIDGRFAPVFFAAANVMRYICIHVLHSDVELFKLCFTKFSAPNFTIVHSIFSEIIRFYTNSHINAYHVTYVPTFHEASVFPASSYPVHLRRNHSIPFHCGNNIVLFFDHWRLTQKHTNKHQYFLYVIQFNSPPLRLHWEDCLVLSRVTLFFCPLFSLNFSFALQEGGAWGHHMSRNWCLRRGRGGVHIK